MQLKELKLAGFKSFVDPTVIPLPSRLIAVVGPNGCGKSNVIDAVRWVMGESSAKSLRGESMTDVIFNGSSHRKPIGQASIELVFDNRETKLSGQYASYDEISIKRTVTRDSESFYFLNGVRCRKRDITDLFLGTGLNPRGYSIISQGTISKIIEARPDELRVYLEEAAGISKYKERRQETLLRMNHTKENLERVDNIREELDKQLKKLIKQAESAEQFKNLKTEERLLKAKILGLKWSDLHQQQREKQQKIATLQLEQAHYNTQITDYLNQLSSTQIELHQSQDNYQVAQKEFYQIKTEIVRLEESIQQNIREKNHLILSLEEQEQDLQRATRAIQDRLKLLEENHFSLEVLQENINKINEELECKEKDCYEIQKEQIILNEIFQRFQEEYHGNNKNMELKKLNLEHLLKRRQELNVNHERVVKELDTIQMDPLNDALFSKKNLSEKLKQQELILTKRLSELSDYVQKKNEEVLALEKQVEEQKIYCHQLENKQGKIVAFQEATMASQYNVDTSKIKHKGPLVNSIQVDKQWQAALEWVLSDYLKALVVDSFDELFEGIEQLSLNGLFFLKESMNDSESSGETLFDKLLAYKPRSLLFLKKIYLVDNLEIAILRQKTLQCDESVITPEGLWIGTDFFRVPPHLEKQKGLLFQKEELDSLNLLLDEARKNLDDLTSSYRNASNLQKEQDRELRDLKEELLTVQSENKILSAEITHHNKLMEQYSIRKSQLTEEKETISTLLEELAYEEVVTNQALEKAIGYLKENQEEYSLLNQKKKEQEDVLIEQQQAKDRIKSTLQQAQREYDQHIIQIEQYQLRQTEEEKRIALIKERIGSLKNKLVDLINPQQEDKNSLENKILSLQKIENTCNRLQESVLSIANNIKELESLRDTCQIKVQSYEKELQQAILEEQSLGIRAIQIENSLQEYHFVLSDILNDFQGKELIHNFEKDLKDNEEKIKRLGAINLAAIEEYHHENERKNLLDEQYLDLINALEMLEKAVERLDKETMNRLKNTFDSVNNSFMTVFPKLFGGGSAVLTLTCDNLLEAGILVMAQPPGKRNSSIHLLSGGEKALAAIALVFAIFQQNPSPFCMLDEVDAPLDDVNVGRFCALVKEMSQFVQFLFITHNKGTMELAEHLIGVTMREPGVSRIVAVDVEQALSISSLKKSELLTE